MGRRAQRGGEAIGLYLHVPFCASRCGYCDFNTYTAGELGSSSSPQSWSEAVRRELDGAADLLGSRPVSTVFVGGGKAHGPVGVEGTHKMPKKMRRKALFTALSERLRKGGLTLVDGLQMEQISTKRFAQFLKDMRVDGRILMLLSSQEAQDEVLYKSARNVPNLIAREVPHFNTREVVWAEGVCPHDSLHLSRVGIGNTLSAARDPRVVDEDVDLAPGVDGRLDDVRGPLPVGDAVEVGDSFSSGVLDLLAYLLRGGVSGPGTVEGAAQVIDHDLGHAAGKEQGVFPTQAAAGPGHCCDAVIESYLCHKPSPFLPRGSAPHGLTCLVRRRYVRDIRSYPPRRTFHLAMRAA